MIVFAGAGDLLAHYEIGWEDWQEKIGLAELSAEFKLQKHKQRITPTNILCADYTRFESCFSFA